MKKPIDTRIADTILQQDRAIDTFWRMPVSALNRVDFPQFGFPTRANVRVLSCRGGEARVAMRTHLAGERARLLRCGKDDLHVFRFVFAQGKVVAANLDFQRISQGCPSNQLDPRTRQEM